MAGYAMDLGPVNKQRIILVVDGVREAAVATVW
jgi:hypothetical protein